MKKVLLVSALVMTIVASMVSGTLAVYQTTLSEIPGSVTAKKFIITEGVTGDFTTPVKIAPTESEVMTFSVTNDNGAVSEVDMNVEVTIVLDDISVDDTNTSLNEDVLAIPPLTVAFYKKDPVTGIFILIDFSSSTLNTTGKGELIYNLGEIFTADVSLEQIFKVVVTWDSVDNLNDTALAGPTNGTKLTVSVTGTQNTL